MDASVALSRSSRLINREFFAGEADERAIAAGLRETTVAIRSDAANLASHAGQSALVTLVSLVARMGLAVELAIPYVPLRGPQPPLRGETLRSALLDFGRDLIPGGSFAADLGRADLTFVLGDTATGADSLRVQGDAWRGEVVPAAGGPGRPWFGDWPFGAFAAAAAAAGEALRVALPRVAREAGLELRPGGHRLQVGVPVAVDLAALFPDLPRQPVRLDADFVSAGAITQAALFVLLRVPGVAGRVRVIDDETLELSNLNRYLLARRSDVGSAKTDTLAALSGDRLSIEGVPLRFEEQTRSRILPLAAGGVAVGVDHIPSRWSIQREWPLFAVVGATENLEVIVSSHRPHEPCAGCLHPLAPEAGGGPAPTISFVSFVAGLLEALELLAAAAGCEPRLRSVLCWALGARGPTLVRLPVAAHAACPVGCPAALALRHPPPGSVAR
jgi:molybdopterin/thiamine biosynthesis adenylyltransferase